MYCNNLHGLEGSYWTLTLHWFPSLFEVNVLSLDDYLIISEAIHTYVY